MMFVAHISPEQAAQRERQEELIARAAELKSAALESLLTELVDASAFQFMPKGTTGLEAYERAAAAAQEGALAFLEETIAKVAR